MKLPYEKGVLPESELFERTPSAWAQELLFCLQRTGHYYCDRHYAVERARLPSFLLLCVVKGRLTVTSRDKTETVEAGNLGLIDCYQPHAYRAAEPLEYLWLHFDGATAGAFCDSILRERGLVFQADAAAMPEKLLALQAQLREGRFPSEPSVSRWLHDLLCELLWSFDGRTPNDPLIADAKRYMEEHLADALTVRLLAQQFHISESQFTRLFRTNTGYAPHEYLTGLRIDRAKRLLKETRRPISEIATAVGFAFDTSFMASFRRATGLSPRAYRNAPM